jgi:hypothetical protein
MLTHPDYRYRREVDLDDDQHQAQVARRDREKEEDRPTALPGPDDLRRLAASRPRSGFTVTTVTRSYHIASAALAISPAEDALVIFTDDGHAYRIRWYRLIEVRPAAGDDDDGD